jgi:cytochrome c-type biogenesis protein CcmH
MLKHLLTPLILVLALSGPVLAVLPDEILPDAALEARARALSQILRCPVCQGENIDDSNADVARDLRRLVRERLLAGDRDDQVLTYITDRYGEYVLFEPEAKGVNLILWLAGPGALILALGGAGLVWRRRRQAELRAATPVLPPELTEEERARLAEILRT